MKIKKYTAPTMPEAMQLIRKELGKDAVILNSREIRTGGFLGLFSRKQLEVVAALDPDAIEEDTKRLHRSAKPSKRVIAEKAENVQEPSGNEELLMELRQLKQLVKHQGSGEEEFSSAFASARDYLIAQDIDEDIAKDLVKTAIEKLGDQKTEDPEKISRVIKKLIEERLLTVQSKKRFDPSRLTYLVGPTGVGKTTTIAKLAAKAMLEHKRKVGLITGDTYRIAAIEQLKTYAKILDIPVEVAYSPAEFRKAADQLADCEMIFADTAGRNFKEDKYIAEISEIVSNSPASDITLVLPLTGKPEDLHKISEQFKNIPVTNILFTKLDETDSYGSILNIVCKYGWPISHIANGQDVPDDLISPTAAEISELIAGEMNNA